MIKKETKDKPQKKKAFKLNLTFQNVILIILLVSYIVIIYAYRYDVNQYMTTIYEYEDILKNPQQLCYAYYNYLEKSNNQQSSPENITKIIEDMFISNQQQQDTQDSLK